MTIFQIECFLAVAEHLNFAKAAEQLNVSQPAITRQIRTLEEELNTQLFIRNTRMVRLTENGRIFQSDAQVMATAARRSIQRFAKKDESNIIDFHIGCANPLHIELLSNTLARLRLDYPTLHPKIRILPETHFADALERESMDAAIGFRSPSLKDSLHYKEVCRSRFACLFQSTLPLTQKEIITADDLTDYPIILYDPGVISPTVYSGQWTFAKDKKPSQLYFCETTENALLLADAGYGVTLLPDLRLPAHQHLTKRTLAGSDVYSFGVFYKSYRSKAYLRDFIRLLQADAENFSTLY